MIDKELMAQNLDRLTQWALRMTELNAEVVILLGVRRGRKRAGLKVLWDEAVPKLELANMLDHISLELREAHRKERGG